MPTAQLGTQTQLKFLLVRNNQVETIPDQDTVTLSFTKDGASSPDVTLQLGTDPELEKRVITAGDERGEGVIFSAAPTDIGLSVGQYTYKWEVDGILDVTHEGSIEITKGVEAKVRHLFEQASRRIAKLAKRVDDPVLTPTPEDYILMRDWLKEAIHEVSTWTDRVRGVVERSIAKGDTRLRVPQEIHSVLKAEISDGSKATELQIKDGPRVARKARGPDPKTGRPCEIAQQGSYFYFFPVPDKAFDLDFYVEYNGEPPADGTLGDVCNKVPSELERALVHYLASEWLMWEGQTELATVAEQRYTSDVQKHADKSTTQSRGTVPYNPLSL